MEQLEDRDIKNSIDTALEDGMAKGLEQGRAEGRAEGMAEDMQKGRAEIVRAMLAKGMDIETISDLTGLAADDIKKHITNKNHD